MHHLIGLVSEGVHEPFAFQHSLQKRNFQMWIIVTMSQRAPETQSPALARKTNQGRLDFKGM